MSSPAKKRASTSRRTTKRQSNSQRRPTPQRRFTFLSEQASSVSSTIQQLCYRTALLAIGAAALFSLCAVLLTVSRPVVGAELLQPHAYLGERGAQVGSLLVRLFGASVVLLLAGLSFLGVKTLFVKAKIEGTHVMKDLPTFLLLQCLVSAVGAAWLGDVGGGRVGLTIVHPVIESVGPLGVTLICALVISQCTLSGVFLRESMRVVSVFGSWMWKHLAGADAAKNIFSLTRLFSLGVGFVKAIGRSCTSALLFPFRIVGRSFARAASTFRPRREVVSVPFQFSSNTKSLSESRKKAAPPPEEKSTPSGLRKKRRKVVSQLPSEGKGEQYLPPSVELLEDGHLSGSHSTDEHEREVVARKICDTLAHFNVRGSVVGCHTGPVITLYEFKPEAGVKVGKIASLQDDLAMRLAAASVRIIAPIPGKETVGIEVPHRHREVVTLRGLFESEAYTESDASLPVAIGKDVCGKSVVLDIANMPHLLIAGATGTGKSVSINSILLSLLERCSPEELGLILIDPKILELSVYEDIPHLRVPVVTESKRVRAVLNWAVKEMDKRYRLMQRFGVRNIDSYNEFVAGSATPEPQADQNIPDEQSAGELSDSAIDDEDIFELPVEVLKPLPKVVIVIDELADLMMQVGREIEELITRLAQKARAAGIHLIVATQRPSVDVITGLIKANFPARMSFRVSSRVDSRTILDSMGAERLLGKGDMLLRKPGAGPLERVHGAFVSDNDVKKFIADLKERNGPPQYDERIIAMCEKAEREEEGGGDSFEADELDTYYDQAVALVTAKGQASTSMIQRQFRIGYNRAARIIEQMEREGIVGPMDGSKAREVLVGSLDPQV